jgi:hypothetical protein
MLARNVVWESTFDWGFSNTGWLEWSMQASPAP